MRWVIHATRFWSDGQLYITVVGAISLSAMAADLFWLQARGRRRPVRSRPFDWACDARELAQPSHVHRMTSANDSGGSEHHE